MRMGKWKCLLLVLLFLMLVTPAFSKGVLVVTVQGVDIEGVKVSVVGENCSFQGITDGDGVCCFSLDEGRYQVFVGDKGKVAEVIENQVSWVTFNRIPPLTFTFEMGTIVGILMLLFVMLIIAFLVKKV